MSLEKEFQQYFAALERAGNEDVCFLCRRSPAEVKRFFAEELDDDIGDLKAELVVDYCMREICPTVYNRAISDAQSYFQGKVEDLGDSCFEPELDYWKKS